MLTKDSVLQSLSYNTVFIMILNSCTNNSVKYNDYVQLQDTVHDDTCIIEKKDVGKPLGIEELGVCGTSFDCITKEYGEPNFMYEEIKKDMYSYTSDEECWLPKYTNNFQYPLNLRVATWERDSIWTLCLYFINDNGIYKAFAGYQQKTDLLILME